MTDKKQIGEDGRNKRNEPQVNEFMILQLNILGYIPVYVMKIDHGMMPQNFRWRLL